MRECRKKNLERGEDGGEDEHEAHVDEVRNDEKKGHNRAEKELKKEQEKRENV